MTLKWQDRIGAVAGFVTTHWKLITSFVGGLIIGSFFL